MATSRRTGNYSTSAKAVIRASDQIFDAAMSGKPDFTKISKEAIKGRSLERRAVTKAEGDVASAGLAAFTKAKRTQNAADTAKEINAIKRPAKRMAGVVAGLGAISGAAMMHKNMKEDKAERASFRAEQDAITAKTNSMFAETQRMQTEMMETLQNGLKDTSTTSPKTSGSEPTNSGSTPVSTPAAPTSSSTSQPKIQAKVSPGFKGMVDMASQAGAKYPQLVAAQWALESGWGKSPSGTNNYFGIKATSGESSTSKQTWEVYGGKEVTTSANFKNYDSPQGSVNDLVSKWHKDYKSYRGVNNASDAFSAADMLRQQGYATDPAYSEKLKKIMRDQGY